METTTKYHLTFTDGGKWTCTNGAIEEGDNVKSFDTVDERSEFLKIDSYKKFDGLGRVISKTDAEIEEMEREALIARNAEIKELLQGDILEAIMNCYAAGVDFVETYPDLAAQREELIAEQNENETKI